MSRHYQMHRCTKHIVTVILSVLNESLQRFPTRWSLSSNTHLQTLFVNRSHIGGSMLLPFSTTPLSFDVPSPGNLHEYPHNDVESSLLYSLYDLSDRSSLLLNFRKTRRSKLTEARFRFLAYRSPHN